MVTDVKEKLERSHDLPSMPAVAIRILDLCQQSEPELDEIAKLLSHDPALTAKLLRLTNSPVYGLKSRVSTVSQAVVILGLNAIQTLALSFSLVKNLQQRDLKPANWFWRRSLLAAVASREIAIAVGCLQSEEAFLAALLQDIGILALRQLGEPGYESLSGHAENDHRGLSAMETELFGMDHATIGGWLCEKWKLPPVLCTAVAYSHAPQDLPPDTHPDVARIARIVAVAGLAADIWMRDNTATATAEVRAMSEQLLQVPSATLDQVLQRVTENSKDVAALFDVAIASQEEMTAILERAKETLLMLAIEATRRVSASQETIDQLQSKAKTLEKKAERDALTGLYNRAYFDRTLDECMQTARVGGPPVSLIIADIDHFKAVNDTHGHLAGDRTLAGVAKVLAAQLRARDVATRYGGEEFALILTEAGPAVAASVAERVRRAVEETKFDIGDGKQIQVTISLGVATVPPRAPVGEEALIGAADAAMYIAKRSGRNRVATGELGSRA
jgi:diguanylate cyclase (GGDEF)-like protein